MNITQKGHAVYEVSTKIETQAYQLRLARSVLTEIREYHEWVPKPDSPEFILYSLNNEQILNLITITDDLIERAMLKLDGLAKELADQLKRLNLGSEN